MQFKNILQLSNKLFLQLIKSIRINKIVIYYAAYSTTSFQLVYKQSKSEEIGKIVKKDYWLRYVPKAKTKQLGNYNLL